MLIQFYTAVYLSWLCEMNKTGHVLCLTLKTKIDGTVQGLCSALMWFNYSK